MKGRSKRLSERRQGMGGEGERREGRHEGREAAVRASPK